MLSHKNKMILLILAVIFYFFAACLRCIVTSLLFPFPARRFVLT